jgi:hypothetical protein
MTEHNTKPIDDQLERGLQFGRQNGIVEAFELFRAHVETQLETWRETGVAPEVPLLSIKAALPHLLNLSLLKMPPSVKP